MAPLEPGDVVILKSGGHSMTVVSVDEEDIDCLWIGDDGQMFRQSIPAVALTVVESLELDEPDDADEDEETEDDEDEEEDGDDDEEEEEEEDGDEDDEDEDDEDDDELEPPMGTIVPLGTVVTGVPRPATVPGAWMPVTSS
jgi:uncharacterized protein YodC (DUF2158 family)